MFYCFFCWFPVPTSLKQKGSSLCQLSLRTADSLLRWLTGVRAGKLTTRGQEGEDQNIPACNLEVKGCRVHLSSSRSWLSLPFGDTRELSRLVQLLTKTADYWTKIKHLPTNLWTGSQTTERTAILRSLFSCLLLWFDWAGEPCLVPPNPQSLDPISHTIWLRRCGWQRQKASIYLLYPLHSSGSNLGAFSLSTLSPWRLNSQQMFSAFVPLCWSQNTFLQNSKPKSSKPTGKQQLCLKHLLKWRTNWSELPMIKFEQVFTGLLRLKINVIPLDSG